MANVAEAVNVATHVTQQLPAIVEYYQQYKTAIFTSSLTLATFLFTMKSFVIATMKKELYDSEKYQAQIAQRRQEGKKEKYYGPLNNLRKLLLVSIFSALISAVLQISVGFYQTVVAAWICFGSAGLSWIIVIYALIIISNNLNTMINNAEDNVSSKETKS